jgi:hypothetical protein
MSAQRIVAIHWLFAVLVWPLFPAWAIAATSVPHLPCKPEQVYYPPPGAPPIVQVWHGADLEQSGWTPPACAGWSSSSRSKLVLAVIGSFRFHGTSTDLLEHSGAISTLRSVHYWSVTDRAWRPLVIDASALSQPDPLSRRADFLPSEMIPGTRLYYWENSSRSGDVVHWMSVREHTPARLVIDTENVTAVPAFLVTLFPPGALQSVKFMERIAPGVWGVYLLSRMGEDASVLAAAFEASYINRAVALYRHIAGIPTDLEPPAAP